MFEKAVHEHAQSFIDRGFDPRCISHVLRHPDGTAWGVATPLQPDADLSGYTERYYTLGYLAKHTQPKPE